MSHPVIAGATGHLSFDQFHIIQELGLLPHSVLRSSLFSSPPRKSPCYQIFLPFCPMASSPSKSSMNSVSRRRNNESRLRCRCNEISPLCISKSIDHPGKRFWGCPNYNTNMYCGFFKWIDEDGLNSDVGDAKMYNTGDGGEVSSLKKNKCNGGEGINCKKNNCDGCEGLIKWIVALLQMIVGLLVGIALILLFLVFKL